MSRMEESGMNRSETQVENRHGQPIGAPLPEWSPPGFPEKQSIAGVYCVLEPLDADVHAKSLFDANAQDVDGKNWTYLPYGPYPVFEEYYQWMNSVCASEDPQFYAVSLKTNGMSVGIVSYLRIAPANGSIEVGHIHFSQLLKRSPAATEAMFLMMKRAFDLGYRRYEWKCDALNAASCSAAERLGLSFEGVFRQAVIYKGRNRDTAWFAAIDSDWPGLGRAFVEWLEPNNFDENGQQRISLRELTGPCLNTAKLISPQ